MIGNLMNKNKKHDMKTEKMQGFQAWGPRELYF